MTIKQITRAYIRHYSDNGQTKAYVEWLDANAKPGRTEGSVIVTAAGNELGSHMRALFVRAEREGLNIEREEW